MSNKITLGLYTFFLLIFSSFTYLFIDQNFIYFQKIYSGYAFVHRLETTTSYIFLVLIFFIFFGLFIRKINKSKFNQNQVRRLVLLTILILFFSYPAMLSYDIFNYIATAKVSFFYHENPYIIMPVEFLGDPVLKFTHAANKIALYGPSWIAMSGMPYVLGLDSYLFTIFNFKLFTVFFYIGSLFFIWKSTQSIYNVTLFGLNPLVIVESLVSLHNDIVMVFFMLASFYFLRQKKILLAFVLLIISIFIKYVTVLLVPVILYVLFKSIRKQRIDWNKLFLISGLIMLLPFTLSFLREEIYPWYALWFLSFFALVKKSTFLYSFIFFLSLGLLIRYAPFMITGTHYGSTPYLKIFFSFSPVVLFLFFSIISRLVVKKN